MRRGRCEDMEIHERKRAEAQKGGKEGRGGGGDGLEITTENDWQGRGSQQRPDNRLSEN